MGQAAPQNKPVRPKVVSGAAEPRPHSDDRGRRIYNDCAGAVFLLYVKSSSGEFIAQGSGFLVASKKIITNAHVAKAGEIVVELGPARVPAHVERMDEFNDLAVLAVDAATRRRWPGASAKVSCRPLGPRMVGNSYKLHLPFLTARQVAPS
jgi:S1-C subfamily serine protease